MKEKSKDGKFTVEIDDKFLDYSKTTHMGERKTAIINLHAVTRSVQLFDVAEAVIDYTFFGGGRKINDEMYGKLEINVYINRADTSKVQYQFNIPNYQSTSDVLPALAQHIIL